MWGFNGTGGQLGTGNVAEDELIPTRIEPASGHTWHVSLVACGYAHTLAATRQGALFAWGLGAHGRLGLGDMENRPVPTLVEAHHFQSRAVVTAAAGFAHSAAVTDDGTLYTWGRARDPYFAFPTVSNLGHGDGDDKLTPARIGPEALQGARVGRCREHSLAADLVVAFAMVTHPRLGPPAMSGMIPELVQKVVEACRWCAWPEGPGGELEGVVLLQGGGRLARGDDLAASLLH
jgi:hypothetical protein